MCVFGNVLSGGSVLCVALCFLIVFLLLLPSVIENDEQRVLITNNTERSRRSLCEWVMLHKIETQFPVSSRDSI